MAKFVRQKLLIAGLAAGLLAGSPALAQDPQEPAEEQTEEAFDEALNQFGYAAGVTHQCSEADAKAQTLYRVQQVFNRLSQLFGTDRAFYFSAAFGAGSVDTIEEGGCDSYKRAFWDALKARNLTDGGR
ncbi:hypothetical protein [Qipengyuania zhejiangensis]|uniref:hypothetical protein n=1 Tax=Qipengyuania zhejiangensis TaxID=3077782 RepID=UPI002D769F0E|nr:hypothetical protein [Qipengyuania sp. Z2]